MFLVVMCLILFINQSFAVEYFPRNLCVMAMTEGIIFQASEIHIVNLQLLIGHGKILRIHIMDYAIIVGICRSR